MRRRGAWSGQRRACQRGRSGEAACRMPGALVPRRYLLPPVIFYAGLSIEKTVSTAAFLVAQRVVLAGEAYTRPTFAAHSLLLRSTLLCCRSGPQLFFSNLGSILALGVMGTALAALLLAAFLTAGFAGLKLLRLQVGGWVDCAAGRGGSSARCALMATWHSRGGRRRGAAAGRQPLRGWADGAWCPAVCARRTAWRWAPSSPPPTRWPRCRCAARTIAVRTGFLTGAAAGARGGQRRPRRQEEQQRRFAGRRWRR